MTIRHLYLQKRFFLAVGIIVGIFIAGAFITPLFYTGVILMVSLVTLTVIDIVLLFTAGKPTATRNVPDIFSLGDDNHISMDVSNVGAVIRSVNVIDELPHQLENRTFRLTGTPDDQGKLHFDYHIRPTSRGAFAFGHIMLFLTSALGLAERKVRCGQPAEVATYPSISQMRQFELKIHSRTASLQGIKKVRRLGQAREFEQIRNYVEGDDYRKINWKATGRRNEIMVNQYQDERSQQIVCLIDKSRSMRSTFNGLTLLDHTINASLVISNIAMLKGDRAGLMTFSDRIGSVLAPGRGSGHMRKLTELLYRQESRFMESDFELLYLSVRQHIKQRSLLLMFTDFESVYSMQRVLPILRKMSKQHLLVVVFFEDNEMQESLERPVESVSDIYQHTLTQRFIMEKQNIVQELNKLGIQSVLTTPEKLSVNTVNKYLEVKSRGMI